MQPKSATRGTVFLSFAIVALFSGCGDSTAPNNGPAEITVTAVDTLRSLGATATLTAVVRNARHEALPDVLVSGWVSSNPALVTVNATTGLVTAVANGSATITAHVGTVTGSSTVTVLQSPVSVALVPPTDTLRSLGATAQYTAVVKDAGGAIISGPVMTWSSANAAVVAIGPQGLANAVSNGSVYVRGGSGGIVDSLQLTVRQRVDPTKSTIILVRALLFVGDTVRATLQARDALDNPLATGGSTVVLSSIGGATGSSSLTFLSTVDLANGYYGADFIGAGVGSPRAVSATIDGIPVSVTPTVTVVGFKKIVALSGGFNKTCGIITTNDLYCWGNQTGGVRGLGTNGPVVSDLTPTLVSGGHQWSDFDVGFTHVCGIAEGGKLYCWGSPSSGDLADGVSSGPNVPTPTITVPESTFIAVSIDLVTAGCAITTSHNATCWGNGVTGRLGNGADTNTTRPVAVSGGNKFVTLATSNIGTCGITDAHAAMCWGYSSVLGMTGPFPDTCVGSIPCAKTPVAVSGGITFKPTIVNDGSEACAVGTDDKTYCWGSTPVVIAGGLVFTALAAGDTDYCGVSQGGTAYCWGSNKNGRFGSPPSTAYQSVPVPVPGGQLFTQLSMGQDHMCGITTDGNAWCWGSNDKGELGDRTTTASGTPVRVKLLGP